MNQAFKQPLVFEFQDAHSFLKAFYRFHKQYTSGFSYESWAEKMSLRSRAYLRALILGERPLQESLLPNFLKGLGLGEKESSYFITLFKIATAPNEELKLHYMKDMFSIWKMNIQTTSVQDITEFLADPLVPLLFTYLNFAPCSDLENAAKDLGADIKKVKEALRCLIWNKLVDGTMMVDGQVSYHSISAYFEVPSLPNNQYLKQFHAQGIKIYEQGLNLPSDQRKFYATYLALSSEQYVQMQSLIQDFNGRVMKLMNQSADGEKKIYRMNQQLIPLTESIQIPSREVVDKDI